MKVEIEEYLRLNNGYIYQWENNDYEWIYEEDGQLVYANGANEYEWESDIIKHSFNIIDLIQVGDYVNGKLVEDIFDKTNYADKSIKLKGSEDYWYNEHIKSIVTREQFESMEYKIKE